MKEANKKTAEVRATALIALMTISVVQSVWDAQSEPRVMEFSCDSLQNFIHNF